MNWLLCSLDRINCSINKQYSYFLATGHVFCGLCIYAFLYSMYCPLCEYIRVILVFPVNPWSLLVLLACFIQGYCWRLFHWCTLLIHWLTVLKWLHTLISWSELIQCVSATTTIYVRTFFNFRHGWWWCEPLSSPQQHGNNGTVTIYWCHEL